MSLLSASSLSKYYGSNNIFSGVSLSVPREARIALIGPNGIGKTTLLRVLIGDEYTSSGKIARSKNLKIGFLPQEDVLESEHTLWEECLKALSGLQETEVELTRLEKVMSDPQKDDDVIARYGSLQEEFEEKGGYTYRRRIRQTLAGLGFGLTDHYRPMAQLSGGQQTRAKLARLLLSEPDLLVLDEPTNHLDIAATEWLEGYLNQWKGAVLIVSHDRYFLDKVVNSLWEMRHAGIEVYSGNYSSYLQQRQERWDYRQKVFSSEKQRLMKEMEYIKRNIAGQNTLQAKGRLKRLSRYLDAVDRIGFQAVQGKKWSQISKDSNATSKMMGVEEAARHIKALRIPSTRPPLINVNIKSGSRSGDLVLRTHSLSIGYADDDKPLFHVPDLTLRSRECAALIGPNGAGKTTFLKTLLKKIPPLSGEVVLGASLQIAHFAQAHKDLNPQSTLVEEIESVAPDMWLADIRHLLARYLFTGDDVFKKVSMLSGGERGRLALAKLSLSDANLLLLDEPTNHLDTPSQEILQDVLQNYQGTILLVSHDRYLIDALSTQIWVIEPDQSRLHITLDTYSQYKSKKESEKESIATHKKKSQSKKVGYRAPSTMSKHRRLKRIKEIETRIVSLEEELSALAIQLEDPPIETEQVKQLGEDYVEIQNEITALLNEWETLHK